MTGPILPLPFTHTVDRRDACLPTAWVSCPAPTEHAPFRGRWLADGEAPRSVGTPDAPVLGMLQAPRDPLEAVE